SSLHRRTRNGSSRARPDQYGWHRTLRFDPGFSTDSASLSRPFLLTDLLRPTVRPQQGVLFGFQFDVDTQGTDFLDQHVEGLGHAGLHAVIAVHDVLVHLGPAVHVVRLDGQHFLQGVGGAVGFQRPDLHLTEALTTELRLTTQRLLGNQAVGTGGTSVHLVVDQVVQFEHVHVADGGRTLELVTGTAVGQAHLAAFRQIGQLQHGLDLGFLGTVEYGGSHRNAAFQVLRQLEDLGVRELVQAFLATTNLVVDLVEELAQFGDLALL